MWWIAAGVALVIGIQAPSTSATAREGTVIDGDKEPDKIPEWVVWEHGLTNIAAWHGRVSGFTQDLRDGMTPEEFDVLERAALAQQRRNAQRELDAEKLRKELGMGPNPDANQIAKFNKRAFEVEMEYRQRILADRDRVLRALSPEGQTVLFAWLAEARAHIHMFVPKGSDPRWLLPE
jgi:hypothetical protein